eukprot:GHVT01069717.1.p2 GENE.GHVT01069717.1~~GHVT01069717.1.p2  ORF type:complete len:140 (+),score=13.42 GHVT01069717.1:2400-2819(+)
MATVVAIHNAVNEKTWQDILSFEALHESSCSTPKLIKFVGKPDQLSWKAAWRHKVQGYEKPFDRHDWLVDRCGKTVRYLVDFYDGEPTNLKPIAIHIDARPAFSFGGAIDRSKMWLKKQFSLLPEFPQKQQETSPNTEG